jgi:hypothetical protein
MRDFYDGQGRTKVFGPNIDVRQDQKSAFTNFIYIMLNRVLKSQIMFEGKAPKRFESGAYTKYVSILNRFATQPSDIRWGFKTRF